MAPNHIAHNEHIAEQLSVVVETQFGPVRGGRARTGCSVFLEIPYALSPKRFHDPEPLPSSFRYLDIEYIKERRYPVQPKNDGQAAGFPFRDKVGLGEPDENPLFLNIVAPPNATPESKFPVKIYIHGGFLQFGSAHGLSGQAQYVSRARNEVWVNIGYRLSAFGFLASDTPHIPGNFGFKDQWLALLWIRENIDAFGGDPSNVTLTGLSAGGHSVHQLLHYASRLPDGVRAPFDRATIQSNSILVSPRTLEELRPQYQALVKAVLPNASGSPEETFELLCDQDRTPWTKIVEAIENLGEFGAFRGATDGGWVASVKSNQEQMKWQRSGGLAQALAKKGVRSIVVGEMSEEWYLYSIADPVRDAAELRANLRRYYQSDIAERMLAHYKDPETIKDPKEFARLYGEITSDGQVYLPVRILSRDLSATDFPFVRYRICWAPELVKTALGYVTHATDRPLWAHRTPVMKDHEIAIADAWLDRIDHEIHQAESGSSKHGARDILVLDGQGKLDWVQDELYDEKMRLLDALPGQS